MTPTTEKSPFPLAFIISISLVSALCIIFEPLWETNDDVALSMIAHGYGSFSTGSPNLLYSNVLWGYFVRFIPEINGVFGYSIATLFVLIAVGTACLYALRKLGIEWTTSVALLALILMRPILFPQFTLNAGLLTVTAIVYGCLYARCRNHYLLLVACLFAFCGYLVRSREFLLVLLIALPLLPWKILLKDKAAQISAVALCMAICISALIDHRAYQGKEWESYNAIVPPRHQILNNGFDFDLKQRPDILAKYDFTENDIDLIQSWFVFDSKTGNHVALNAMLAELGRLPSLSDAVARGWVAVKAFKYKPLVFAFIAALLLMFIHLRFKLFLSWSLCFWAFFIIGMLGRPAVLRIYAPVLALLLLAPFWVNNISDISLSSLRKRLTQGVIIVAALLNIGVVFSESWSAQAVYEQVRRDMQGFPSDVNVIWTEKFPLERIYPVLKQTEQAMAYKLYAMHFEFVPSSLASAEQKAGRGMLDRLVSKEGVPIITNERAFGLLSKYCDERFNGSLHELASRDYGQVHISWRQCQIAQN